VHFIVQMLSDTIAANEQAAVSSSRGIKDLRL